MTLLEYLEAEGLTLDDFGARIGRSGATVSRIARGVVQPSWDTMRKIEAATKGKVQPNDFRSEAA